MCGCIAPPIRHTKWVRDHVRPPRREAAEHAPAPDRFSPPPCFGVVALNFGALPDDAPAGEPPTVAQTCSVPCEHHAGSDLSEPMTPNARHDGF
jgi:hypothetical protein